VTGGEQGSLASGGPEPPVSVVPPVPPAPARHRRWAQNSPSYKQPARPTGRPKQLDHSRLVFHESVVRWCSAQRPGFCHRIPRKAKRGMCGTPNRPWTPCKLVQQELRPCATAVALPWGQTVRCSRLGGSGTKLTCAPTRAQEERQVAAGSPWAGGGSAHTGWIDEWFVAA